MKKARICANLACSIAVAGMVRFYKSPPQGLGAPPAFASKPSVAHTRPAGKVTRMRVGYGILSNARNQEKHTSAHR